MKRNRLDFRQSTPRPLILVVGLPPPISTTVLKTVETEYRPTPRVLVPPSSTADDHLYKPAYCESLIRAVSEYAERQRKASPSPPVPEHVLLAYVPSPDDDTLLRHLEFFVFPVRLSRLAEYNEHGRQLRHDLKVANSYVLSSIESAVTVFAELKRRLSSVTYKEPLHLPPNNFWISQDTRMAHHFSELLRGHASWSDPFTHLCSVNLRHEDLPYNIPRGAQKTVFRDSRGLVFPPDRTNHGPSRELPPGSGSLDRELLLKSAFRFGVRLTDGYHHDVQLVGKEMKGQVFNCAVEGKLTLNCSHANVYPDDFVRPSEKK